MMKKMTALLLCVLLVLGLAACGGESETKTVDLIAVRDKLYADIPVSDPVELSTDRLTSLYGITADSVKANASFFVMSDIFPATIIMIEAVDAAAADDIAAKLQTALDSLKQQSQSYDAESYAIAQACSVMRDGNYVAMFFSEDGAAMETVYKSFF